MTQEDSDLCYNQTHIYMTVGTISLFQMTLKHNLKYIVTITAKNSGRPFQSITVI